MLAGFYRLGVPVFPIAAEHGTGVDDLLDEALNRHGQAVEDQAPEEKKKSRSPSSAGPTWGNPLC